LPILTKYGNLSHCQTFKDSCRFLKQRKTHETSQKPKQPEEEGKKRELLLEGAAEVQAINKRHGE